VDSIVLSEQGWEEEEERTRERYNEAIGLGGAAMMEYIKIEGRQRLALGKYFDPPDSRNVTTMTRAMAIRTTMLVATGKTATTIYHTTIVVAANDPRGLRAMDAEAE
jgi:hypothetical protein